MIIRTVAAISSLARASALAVPARAEREPSRIEDANVTLSGRVGDPALRERAIQIARGVQGVKDVRHSISVN